MKRILIGLALVALMGSGAAIASDHLANGATAPGSAERGFTNPVATNPSGTSGAASMPGTVPGLGNPNAGAELGTPAFDPDVLQERLDAKQPF